MADKAREGALVETTRKLYSWFPPGRIVDFEKPDFLLIDGDDRTGIEVTEMFQPPKHGSKHDPHVVAKFHQRVMAIAERRAESLPPVDGGDCNRPEVLDGVGRVKWRAAFSRVRTTSAAG